MRGRRRGSRARRRTAASRRPCSWSARRASASARSPTPSRPVSSAPRPVQTARAAPARTAPAWARERTPTVRSRCQVVRLDPLPAAEVARVLDACGLSPEQARELAPLAEGSPGRALALAGKAEALARALVLRDLPRLRELGADELSRTAQALARGALDAGLATALAWYRDVLETALAGDAAALRNPAAADAVRLAARRLSPPALLRQLEAVYDTIVALEKNANRMLAVETMLLSLRAIE